MIEKITKTGRKFFLVISVFFLGVVASPPGWNFWDFLAEVSHNPETMRFVLYGVAGLLVVAAILYVAGQIKKEE